MLDLKTAALLVTKRKKEHHSGRYISLKCLAFLAKPGFSTEKISLTSEETCSVARIFMLCPTNSWQVVEFKKKKGGEEEFSGKLPQCLKRSCLGEDSLAKEQFTKSQAALIRLQIQLQCVSSTVPGGLSITRGENAMILGNSLQAAFKGTLNSFLS